MSSAERALPSPDGEPAVRAVSVEKAYGSSSSPVLALRGVTVEIRRGEKVALLGKSGSGKSTLLNVVGGLDRPTSGSIWVAGQELGQDKPKYRTRMPRLSLLYLLRMESRPENVARPQCPSIWCGLSPEPSRNLPK